MRLFALVMLPLALISAPVFAECTASDSAYAQSMHRMHSMMDIAYTGDADIDFVAGMIPHHQGAIDMAKVEWQYGKDPVMRELAGRILRWQQAEIGFMSSWLRGRQSGWRAPDAESKASTVAFKQAMEKMHQGMMTGYTGNADIDFARGMIPHHQGAIDMAAILKRDGKSQDLRKLASEIIRSQGQEIALMQAWLETQPQPATHEHTKGKKPKAKAHTTHKPEPVKPSSNDHHAHH